MKLLFDQNLSHRLVTALSEHFPGSAHVKTFGLERADDSIIREFAKQNGFMITSKDDDFHQRSLVYGHPPKVVWLRVGNASTDQIVEILRTSSQSIRDFDADSHASLLVIP